MFKEGTSKSINKINKWINGHESNFENKKLCFGQFVNGIKKSKKTIVIL